MVPSNSSLPKKKYFILEQMVLYIYPLFAAPCNQEAALTCTKLKSRREFRTTLSNMKNILMSDINSAHVRGRFNTELLLQLLMNANFSAEFEEDSEFESEIERNYVICG